MQLTRTTFLGRTAAAAGTLAVGRIALAPAAAAARVPEADLAWLRLLLAWELLLVEFHERALVSGTLPAPDGRAVRRALAHERAHAQAAAAALADAGETPATRDDFTFALGRASFRTRRALARLGLRLEEGCAGSYLGAVGALQTPALVGPLGQVAACEAGHVGLFRSLAGAAPLGAAFPPALDVAAASAAQTPYLR